MLVFTGFLCLFGIIVTTAAGLLWHAMARSRRAMLDEIRASKLTRADPFAAAPTILYKPGESQAPLPKVSVVLPCIAPTTAQLEHWKQDIKTLYQGPVEFIFVTALESDPAYELLVKIRELHPEKVSVYTAGHAWHCSQRNHNILEGIARLSSDSEMLLVLDPECVPHPSTVTAMTKSLLQSPDVFVTSGYVFDMTPPEASLPAYLYLAYRLITLPAAWSEHPPALWGGSLMYRTREIRANTYGILDRMRLGGYAYDLITMNLVKEFGRDVACPRAAIMPFMIDGQMTTAQAWERIRHLLYVGTTYSSPHERRENRSLLVFALVAGLIYAASFAFYVLLAIRGLAGLRATFMERLVLFFFTAALIFAFESIRYMVYCLTLMCRLLASTSQRPVVELSMWTLVKAMPLACTMIVTAALSVLISPEIEAGGAIYTRARGRIVKVSRFRSDGSTYSEPLADSLQRAEQHYASLGFNPGPTYPPASRDASLEWHYRSTLALLWVTIAEPLVQLFMTTSYGQGAPRMHHMASPAIPSGSLPGEEATATAPAPGPAPAPAAPEPAPVATQ